ncbi:PspA/IM30 family protein [Indiicoccus explosivorum]|uniref:PspA/IM30 family protein n=1 Tax=Indiicoccus explosivorum TaxID=1917864 RepID=UPI000B454616|nr:PspA/IM30 family protein [Indiicoccus explosivorum]
MTTAWNRLKFAFASDIDALLTKKEQQNPLALLNRYIKDAEQQTADTGKWLERQSQLITKLEKELEEASALLEKRSRQQELAAAAGEEELAQFAERETAAYSGRVSTLEASIADNRKEYQLLEQKYEDMKHKVKDMKIRQLQLMGKENATRANVYMDRVLHPEKDEEGFGTADEMNSYIERLGSRIEEQHEQNVLVHRLEALEKNSAHGEEIR